MHHFTLIQLSTPGHFKISKCPRRWWWWCFLFSLFVFYFVVCLVCRRQNFSTRHWRRNYRSEPCQGSWASLRHSVTFPLHDLEGQWLAQWPISSWPSQSQPQWCAQWPALCMTSSVLDQVNTNLGGAVSDLPSTRPWRSGTFSVTSSLHDQVSMSLSDVLSDLPSSWP